MLHLLRHICACAPQKQGWQYGTIRKYGTVRSNFKPKLRYVGTVHFKEYVAVYFTLVRYG